MNSFIYQGNVRHRRFSPKNHSFNYSLYMLALNVSEIEQEPQIGRLFGFSWFNPMRFNQKDYVSGEPSSLQQRIKEKVESLSSHLKSKNEIQRIVMLVQVRCFGLYFSPANFYFCYNKDEQCTAMLAEVSNTPWNQRHYYLVNLDNECVNEKKFHVSPFMDLNMNYHWKIKPPALNKQHLSIHIENRRKDSEQTKLFDATLQMTKTELNAQNVLKLMSSQPLMTLKIVTAIYWQAMKLFVKRIPFISYQKAQ